MHQSPEAEILQSAAGTGRVVITADQDFPRLLAALGSTGPGLILLRGGSYSESESRDCARRVLMSIPQTELSRSLSWSTVKESGGVGFLFDSSGPGATFRCSW